MKFNILNRKIIFNLIVTLTLITIIIVSSFKIIYWFKDNKSNKEILENLQNEVKDNDTSINFEKLQKKNSDTVAWLKLNNSIINYPVVKYTNNEYYLNHSFDNSQNAAGWIFMDYRNSKVDKNIIIYGHNRKDGSMFGSLKKILENYEETENRKLILTFPDEDHEYIIYSAFIVKDEDVQNYLKTNFSSNNEFATFVEKTLSYNTLNIKTDPTKINNIVTLYTCHGSNQKLLVFAYEIEEPQ